MPSGFRTFTLSLAARMTLRPPHSPQTLLTTPETPQIPPNTYRPYLEKAASVHIGMQLRLHQRTYLFCLSSQYVSRPTLHQRAFPTSDIMALTSSLGLFWELVYRGLASGCTIYRFGAEAAGLGALGALHKLSAFVLVLRGTSKKILERRDRMIWSQANLTQKTASQPGRGSTETPGFGRLLCWLSGL